MLILNVFSALCKWVFLGRKLSLCQDFREFEVMAVWHTLNKTSFLHHSDNTVELIVSVILVGSNEDVDSSMAGASVKYYYSPPKMFHANVMREDEQKNASNNVLLIPQTKIKSNLSM